MPLTTIDERAALIVIDLQKGIAGLPTVHPFADIVSRASHLAAAFRERGLPVVLVNVAGTPTGRTDAGQTSPPRPAPPADWADLDAQTGDLRITKAAWGAFHGTPLDARLRELGVTQVFLAGISTSIGVESTARAAHEHGYNVVLVADAMTDRDASAHENSLTRIFPRLGETATTDEVLATLAAHA